MCQNSKLNAYITRKFNRVLDKLLPSFQNISFPKYYYYNWNVEGFGVPYIWTSSRGILWDGTVISLMGEACSPSLPPSSAVIKHGADKLHSLRDTRGGDFRIQCPRFVIRQRDLSHMRAGSVRDFGKNRGRCTCGWRVDEELKRIDEGDDEKKDRRKI